MPFSRTFRVIMTTLVVASAAIAALPASAGGRGSFPGLKLHGPPLKPGGLASPNYHKPMPGEARREATKILNLPFKPEPGAPLFTPDGKRLYREPTDDGREVPWVEGQPNEVEHYM